MSSSDQWSDFVKILPVAHAFFENLDGEGSPLAHAFFEPLESFWKGFTDPPKKETSELSPFWVYHSESQALAGFLGYQQELQERGLLENEKIRPDLKQQIQELCEPLVTSQTEYLLKDSPFVRLDAINNKGERISYYVIFLGNVSKKDVRGWALQNMSSKNWSKILLLEDFFECFRSIHARLLRHCSECEPKCSHESFSQCSPCGKEGCPAFSKEHLEELISLSLHPQIKKDLEDLLTQL